MVFRVSSTKLYRHLALAALLIIAPFHPDAALSKEPRRLTVYTYDSFISAWGPGPQIEAGFEAQCGCDLQFVPAGDGAALLTRLLLEGENSAADVVLGLDTNLIARARKTGLFAPHGIEAAFDLPISWEDAAFLPYDWGYFAFVYDRGRIPHPPSSFEELATGNWRIVIQDPRSSTPGLGLMWWVEAAYGDSAPQIWADLAPKILTVTPGWSEAYGLFLDGEADFVLSYTTSPAYHSLAEGDESKAAALFEEGHYMQIEVMAMMKRSAEPDLAQAFLQFMISPEAQAALPMTNWMYPVIWPEGGLPESFTPPLEAHDALLLPPEEIEAKRKGALERWRIGLSK